MTAPDSATLWVNGEERPLTDAPDVVALVSRYVPQCAADGAPRGVAVAVNDRVVPRGSWGGTRLTAGDRVEIVTAVQGG